MTGGGGELVESVTLSQPAPEAVTVAPVIMFARDGGEKIPFGEGRPVVTKVCKSCGEEFSTTFPNKETCDDRCRQAYKRAKSRNV